MIRKAEGRKLAAALWGVWAGAPDNNLDQWLAAVQVAAGNRRPTVGGRANVRAVVRGDVTLHSHVRLSTRGAAPALGSRQAVSGA